MKKYGAYCTLLLILGAPVLAQSTNASEPSHMEYLENEYVKLGVDLRLGGAITVIIDKQRDERNLINSHDWGRQV